MQRTPRAWHVATAAPANGRARRQAGRAPPFVNPYLVRKHAAGRRAGRVRATAGTRYDRHVLLIRPGVFARAWARSPPFRPLSYAAAESGCGAGGGLLITVLALAGRDAAFAAATARRPRPLGRLYSQAPTPLLTPGCTPTFCGPHHRRRTRARLVLARQQLPMTVGLGTGCLRCSLLVRRCVQLTAQEIPLAVLPGVNSNRGPQPAGRIQPASADWSCCRSSGPP